MAKWPKFQRRYREELAEHAEEVSRLIDLVCRGPLTLVFAARDTEHNSAAVLKAYLNEQFNS